MSKAADFAKYKDLLPLTDVVTIAALTDKLLTISEKVLSFLSWVLYKTKKTYTGRFFTGSALKVLSMELVPLNREKNDWFSHKSTKKADEPGSSKRRNPFNISSRSEQLGHHNLKYIFFVLSWETMFVTSTLEQV